MVPHTIISLIRESWRLSNSHFELNFFNSVTKSWRFWPFLLPLCKKLVVKNDYVFPRVTVFRKFVKNRSSNFMSSPGSKVKVSYIFLPFWPMHVRKLESLYFIILSIFFCCRQIKIKVFELEFPAMRYIAVKWESLRMF